MVENNKLDPSEEFPGYGGDREEIMARWHHTWTSPKSLTIAALFVLVTFLTFLVSITFGVLLLVPVLLSFTGLRQPGDRSGRLRASGEVMVFNGMVLLVSLILVGFVRDFLLARPEVLDETVALAYTIVHVMLGLGLFFVDFRTLSSSGKTPGAKAAAAD